MKEIFQELKEIFHSDHPFRMIAADIWDCVLKIWNYSIFTTAQNEQIHISNIITGLILFSFGLRVVKKLTFVFKNKLASSFIEPSAVNSLERLAYYFFMTLMVVFVLDLSKVPLTIFTVIGTTLALGIGLGSQNIVNNFISGIIIMIERPIKIGDIIEVKNIVGEVTSVGARCTSIKTSSNISMLIPNSSILQDTIVNWTLDDTTLKKSLKLSIEDTSANFSETEKLILEVLRKHPHILKNPAPKIFLTELCSRGYELEMEFWIDLSQKESKKGVINDINRALLTLLKENNLGIIDRILNGSEHSAASVR